MDREFDIKMLRVAYGKARESRDLSTQLGAVLVSTYTEISSGCNNFPDGVLEHSYRLERPAKYAYVEHAERMAIYNAAAWGFCTLGTTMYVPWFACPDCARAIVCCKIKRVVGHKQMDDRTPASWAEPVLTGKTILLEGGVEFELIDVNLGLPFSLRMNGELWTP